MGLMAVEDEEDKVSHFHVLVVDDNPIDRKLIEKLLKTSSYQVTTVDSGYKALHFLGLNNEVDDINDDLSTSPNIHKKVEVNLVITDFCMPGMTGYDLLIKIKESSCLRNIPVVIMSSENVPSQINSCLEEGAEEFFLKPIRLSDLNRLKPYLKLKKDQELGKLESEGFNKTVTHSQDQKELPLTLPLPLEKSQQVQQQSSINNKRKPLEEGLTSDRAEHMYNGMTTMI